GKVAVQRAYADWRRYPQYIVPLSEASVDLIFAPAYGSSKKNATDIRLAIDALELVFTRPEIGVFILLSGDSDFSSLVLKLKEYGKYVIGVGIRESSSDLLVQNCDEYYSYSALSGLTKAGEDAPSASEDPWVLVERAVRQMAEKGDVMRSDRLKQVLIELDPNFDERTLGYSKFSKFVAEAANRGCLRLRKLENGQYEVGPADGAESPSEEEQAAPRARREEGARRGRREREERAPRREREREERPSRREREEQAAEAVEAAPAAAAPAAQERGPVDAVRAAYELLRRAVEGLARRPGEAVRDSDVKRRMLELQPGWDESTLGFSKFSRFLRQAHDMEVIDLRKTDNGAYEVTPPSTRGHAMLPVGGAAEPAAPAQRSARDERGAARSEPRSKRRDSAKQKAAPAEQAAVPAEPAAAAPEEPVVVREEPAVVREEPAAATPAAPEPKAAPVQAPEPAPAAPAPAAAVPAPGVLRYRRGTRGRSLALAGPPPVLAGQTIPLAEERNGAAAPEESAATGATAEEPRAERKTARSRRGGARKAQRAASSSRAVRKGPAAAAKATKPAKAASAGAAPAAESLPTEPAAVIARLTTYPGVGRKTAETLIEALGAENVFPALRDAPDRIREALGGGRRAELLISAWQAEAGAAGDKADGAAAPAARAEGAGGEAKRTRGRRGGRRGKAPAKAVAAGGD